MVLMQAACIPIALMGRDICASAMTGSGKVYLCNKEYHESDYLFFFFIVKKLFCLTSGKKNSSDVCYIVVSFHTDSSICLADIRKAAISSEESTCH